MRKYCYDSEGNRAQEIPFSEMGMRKIDDEWLPYEETLTGKDSVFHRELPIGEESEKREKRLAFLQLASGSLTPKQREVIVLAFNHHKSNREIAEMLNISSRAVSKRRVQALKKLRKILIGK